MSNILNGLEQKEKHEAAIRSKEELIRSNTVQNLKQMENGELLPAALPPIDLEINDDLDIYDDDLDVGNSKMGKLKEYLSKLTPLDVFQEVKTMHMYFLNS